MGFPICTVVAALSLTAGYSLLAMLFAGALPAALMRPATAYTALATIGVGSAFAYAAGLTTNAKNFATRYRGRVVGLVAAFFGLSSFVFSGLFQLFKDGDDVNFQGFFIAIAVLVIVLNGAALFGLVDRPPPAAAKYGLLNEAEEDAPAPEMEAAVRVTTGKDLLTSKDAGRAFWALAVAMAFGVGSGLVFINNAGGIVNSLGGSLESTLYTVELVSVFNMLGRLGMGAIADATRATVHRGYLLAVASSTMAAAYAGLFLSDSVLMVEVLGCVLGFAYGSLFSLGPQLISLLFGTSNFAANWGILTIGPAVWGFALNQYASWLYRSGIEGDAETCVGHECFTLTFATLFVVLLVTGWAGGVGVARASPGLMRMGK